MTKTDNLGKGWLIGPLRAGGRAGAMPRTRREYALDVLRVLAGALAHGVPVTPALNGLVDGPWFTSPTLRASKARDELRLFVADLEAGATIGTAIMRHYSKALPTYVIEAVVRAEELDRLAVVLPALVQVFSGGAPPFSRFRAALLYPVMQLLLILMLVSGLLVFIVPKFSKLFDEMAPGEALSATNAGLTLSILADLSGLIVAALWALVIVLVLCKIVGPAFRHTDSFVAFREWVSRFVPLIRGIVKSEADLDMYRAMAALVAAGMDVPPAAEQAAHLVKSPGAAQRLIRFMREAHGGMPWPDAWERATQPSPICQFLLRNAAGRECPAEGFVQAALWQEDNVARRVQRIARWAEPAGILFNSALVGLTVYALIGSLFSLLQVASS